MEWGSDKLFFLFFNAVSHDGYESILYRYSKCICDNDQSHILQNLFCDKFQKKQLFIYLFVTKFLIIFKKYVSKCYFFIYVVIKLKYF